MRLILRRKKITMQRKSSLLVRMFITLMVVVSLGAVFTQPVIAQPPALPHAFFGTLTINDKPAPVGTVVEAKGEGVNTDIQGNPIITTEEGWYGSSDPLKPKLVVQGNIIDGTLVTFYVNGESTGQTWEWYTGEVNRVDLALTTSAEPAAPAAEPVAEPAEEPAGPAAKPTKPVVEPTKPVVEPTEPIAGPLEAAETPIEDVSATNWPVIGGIIAAVVVVALLVFFFVIRKRGAY
jgi:hypothetical protein